VEGGDWCKPPQHKEQLTCAKEKEKQSTARQATNHCSPLPDVATGVHAWCATPPGRCPMPDGPR